VTIAAHDGPDGAWEMAWRPPRPGTEGIVTGWCGYVERGAPLRRREVPHGGVTLILSFGDSIRIASAERRPERLTSFAAGLHDGPVLTEHDGRQEGVEVLLTPLGAYRLFGLPMSELANTAVALGDLWGPRATELAERMAGTKSWEARFAAFESALTARLRDAPEPDKAVTWAWHQLERSNGGVAVEALADEIGWSRRHFAVRFRAQVGLTPKATARVLRFHRAVGLLDGNRTISDTAAAAGYADHSHMVREFRSLAGCTPSAFVAAQQPDGPGVIS
jgi:AraC-like DNA-binding protein